MAIEGALQDVSLADICQLLGMGRKTGCLSITDRSNFGYIYFRDGRVIHASMLNRPDRLGEMLVRNRIVTRDDLARAVQEQTEGSSKRLGEILLEQGMIDQETLKTYVEQQIEEAVYHLFTWVQGTFHFDPDQPPDEDVTALVDISPESLLMEGARRVDEWSLVEKKIPSMDIVFQLDRHPDDGEEEFELTPEQRKVLPLLDGERTANEIMIEAGLVEFDTGKALYGLIQAGFVSQVGARPTVAEAGGDEQMQEHLNLAVAFYRSGMMDDARREVAIVLESDPKLARAHFLLGLIALRAGDPLGALRHFDDMPEERRDAYSVHRNRALALELAGRHEEALTALREARSARPDDPEVHLHMAIVHLKARDAEAALEALRTYRSLPKLRKASHIYYNYAILASAMAGNLDQAVAVGLEGLSIYPESGPLLVNAGAVLERRGEPEAAEALYKRAIATTPTPPQAHKNLGDQAWARGDLQGARLQYEKAVKIAPWLGDDVLLRLSIMAIEENEPDVAVLMLKRALKLNPRNATARAKLEMLERP
jgi:tetratricopeptide (TPR) repeat protein